MATLRARVPDVSCVIAGRGSYLPELQTQIDVEGVSDLIYLYVDPFLDPLRDDLRFAALLESTGSTTRSGVG